MHSDGLQITMTGHTHSLSFKPAYLLVALLPLVYLIFDEGIVNMVRTWQREEYSHSYLIPAVVLFLIWQKKHQLAQTAFSGSWPGFFVVLAGLMLYVVGELATLYTVIQYAFLVFVYGVILSLMGWQAFRIVLVPLLMLVFMIPLPNFLYNNLSAALQLISSELGVAVIRWFGISVYLEGNVIDLGHFKLQVVEACNGLRYLFPLMSIAFICAYLFRGAWWKRAVIFLSSIPITVLMNSFRIGVIGSLTEYWGPDQAQGFLHDFEGWAVFMLCTGVLVVEMWLLSLVGGSRKPLHEVFAIEGAAPSTKVYSNAPGSLPGAFLGTILLVVVTVLGSLALPQRAEAIPERQRFASFPLEVGSWRGRPGALEQIYVDALKFDDYFLADYTDAEERAINFYVAYYGSQRKGQSAHSPRSCLPGGGWEIADLSQRRIEGVRINGHALTVNRTEIHYGEQKQLVYYWFQQRDRVITNEYLVKWYLFWDALTRNRTDGALVRLSARLRPGENIQDLDHRLADFAKGVSGLLTRYVPN